MRWGWNSIRPCFNLHARFSWKEVWPHQVQTCHTETQALATPGDNSIDHTVRAVAAHPRRRGQARILPIYAAPKETVAVKTDSLKNKTTKKVELMWITLSNASQSVRFDLPTFSTLYLIKPQARQNKSVFEEIIGIIYFAISEKKLSDFGSKFKKFGWLFNLNVLKTQ